MTEQNDPNVIRFHVRYVTPEELASRQRRKLRAKLSDAERYRLWQAERLIEEAGLA